MGLAPPTLCGASAGEYFMVGIMSSWRRRSDPTGSTQSCQPANQRRQPIPISHLPHGRRPISILPWARQPMVIELQRRARRTIKVQDGEEDVDRKRKKKKKREEERWERKRKEEERTRKEMW